MYPWTIEGQIQVSDSSCNSTGTLALITAYVNKMLTCKIWSHTLSNGTTSYTSPVELQLESDTLVSWPLIGQVWEFPNSDHAHFSCNELSDWTRKRVLSTASAHRVLQGQTLSSIIRTFFIQYKTLWFALWIFTSRWLPMGVNIATSIFNIRKISIDMC